EVAEPGRASSQHAASHEMLPPPVAPIAAVTDTHSAQTHVHAVRTAGGAEAMERVTKLLDLQATQGARPLQNVLLRMGRDGGTEDLLRIGMRGTSVDASLGIGDPLRAAELGGRVSELRAALERRGLGADGVQVQATRGVDRAEWSGAVAPALDIGALRAAGEAALAQQQGGRDAEAQRRQFQQDQQPGAASRDDRKPTNRAHDDDARRQPRRSPQEQPK
ncbi:MAG: hypothetical protein MUF40_01590, partial [Gemmatimonadaceae bacterium]|nr:hypothetical protein [Gemmatimonadaceae bacterium]